jgi:hypothetical protein
LNRWKSHKSLYIFQQHAFVLVHLEYINVRKFIILILSYQKVHSGTDNKKFDRATEPGKRKNLSQQAEFDFDSSKNSFLYINLIFL